MQFIEIKIKDISEYRANIVVVHFSSCGIIPFKWCENEEAWLFDPQGARLNIDHIWDSNNKDILSVGVLLPS